MKPDFLTVVLTRVSLAGLLLALLVPAAPQVMGKANALIGNSVYEVTVHIRLVAAHSAGPLEESSRAVVWLVPTKPGRVARLHTIGNVPHGKYVLHVWYENSAPQVLEALQRTIFVGDGNRSLPTISIALANEIPMNGKNYNSEQPTFVGANWGRR
jgi:hypothetical protein